MPDSNSRPDFLTVDEARRTYLRIGRDSMYRLINEGKLPSVRLGRSIRIPRHALLRYLERQAEESLRP
jgi:excisionase family DNA binding protein